MGAGSVTAFDKAWGVVKAKPYYGNDSVDGDRCDVCVGPLEPPLFQRKDGSIVCSMCEDFE